MNLNMQLNSEKDFIAFALVAGSEMANKWLQSQGELEADIRNMLATGAGLELVLTLHPVPSIDIKLIHVDGSTVKLAAWVINNTTAH